MMEANSAEIDSAYMLDAIALARNAAARSEVPVGAVVVADGQIIGRGANSPIGGCDPTAHAEVVAIRNACTERRNYRLPDATLYVTIEPCTMCLGTIIHARIKRVVYGAAEPKAGVLHSNTELLSADFYNHQLEITGGVEANTCSELISEFFAERRRLKAQLKGSRAS